MTTTGQLLVSLSGLPSGSALAHLAAITTGTGTGETVFAHRMDVTIQQPKHTITSRAKRSAQSQPAEVRPAENSQKKGIKFVFLYQKQASITVLTTEDEAYVSTNLNTFYNHAKQIN